MEHLSAVITGITGGLGQAVGRFFLEKGVRVTAPYHTEKTAFDYRDSLPDDLVNRLELVPADLTGENTAQAFFDRVGAVDILVHLAGGFDMGETAEYELEKWHHQMALNLTSTFLVCRAVLKGMVDRGYGRIVTIGSRAAQSPQAQAAAYSAAKAGVVALTRSIAEETRGTGVTANCVLPGVIDTPGNRRSMGEKNRNRWVSPESLAGIIFFLASEAAGDIRGAAIPVYGDG